MKAFIIRLLSVLCFVSFCSMLLWHYVNYSHPHITGNAGIHGKSNAQEIPDSVAAIAHQNSLNSDAALSHPLNVKQNPANKRAVVSVVRHIVKRKRIKSNNAASVPLDVKQNPIKSKESEIIDSLLANYTSKWERQEKNIQSYRSLLNEWCNAISNATITQENSPVGEKITYDGDHKKTVEVTPSLSALFPKETPFKNAPYDSCAVVGNGGILANSRCGKRIDSASFVIRCNLPPLSNGHERDTGNKTNLVTANPSILYEKYHALNNHRRSFVEDMKLYGDALLLLPTFSFWRNTAVSLRVVYSLDDLSIGGPRPVFFNPEYLRSLKGFWHANGIHSLRLSTGIMMASLALQLCNNVHLYGFWPFGTHLYTRQKLNNHYYDNRPVNKRLHAMPAEFNALLNLHNKGVIHLHLGECTN